MSLLDFVRESNAIEGIHRVPLDEEVFAHERFLARASIDVIDLQGFVHVVAGAKLRDRPGMNVRIDTRHAPPGGPDIKDDLLALLAWANDGVVDAYMMHVAYERLHPFMDGNGRSGRVLWAWMMTRSGCDPFVRPFLQTFYYQTLDAAR